MEELWLSTSKPAQDGKRTITLKGVQDLGFLYISGFVDVQKNSFQDWVNSFADSRQKDGSYLLSHDQWMAKKKFRYTGPVGEPFDPMSLEEKEYTEQEFITFIEQKIIPNTIFDKSAIPRVIAEFKVSKKIQNGKIFLDKNIKKLILQTVNDHPSPLRILQVMVEAFRKKEGMGAATSQLDAQKSQFSAGKTAQEIARARLAEMAGVMAKEEASLANVPTISIKDLGRKKTPGRI